MENDSDLFFVPYLGLGFPWTPHAMDGLHMVCLQKKRLNVYSIAAIPPGKHPSKMTSILDVYLLFICSAKRQREKKKDKRSIRKFSLGDITAWEGPPNSPATSTLIVSRFIA